MSRRKFFISVTKPRRNLTRGFFKQVWLQDVRNSLLSSTPTTINISRRAEWKPGSRSSWTRLPLTTPTPTTMPTPTAPTTPTTLTTPMPMQTLIYYSSIFLHRVLVFCFCIVFGFGVDIGRNSSIKDIPTIPDFWHTNASPVEQFRSIGKSWLNEPTLVVNRSRSYKETFGVNLRCAIIWALLLVTWLFLTNKRAKILA